MPGTLENVPPSLEQELAAIAAEWERIGTEFAGPAPEMSCSATDWAEAIENNLLLRRPAPDGDNLPNFAAAFGQTASAIKQLFLDRFARWAVQTVATAGTDYFQQLNIPDPPIHPLPLPSRGTESAPAWLTGTANTSEAGCRVIFWAAAYHDPQGLRRSLEITRLVFMWVDQTVEFFDSDQGPRSQGDHQGEWFGRCFPVRELMTWVAQGLASLHKMKATDASACLLPATEKDLNKNPESENRDEPASSSPIYLMHNLRGTVSVQFGPENGCIRGKQATRLCRLIREKRVDALELGGDLVAADASPSIVDLSEIEATYGKDVSSAKGRYVSAANKELLRQLNDKARRLKREVEEATTDAERNDSHAQLQITEQEIKEILQPTMTRVDRAREKIERGIRWLVGKTEKEMPEFSKHINQSIRYDGVESQFTYVPTVRPDWEFRGFD
jgi:hypothetical protein